MTALLAAALAVTPGVWSSYRVHPTTGDELGMELELSGGARPGILFTLCEGQCSRPVRLPIRPIVRGFTFTYSFPANRGDGTLGPPIVLHYEARMQGRRLVVRQPDQPDAGRDRLHRIARRRGLAVAALATQEIIVPRPGN